MIDVTLLTDPRYVAPKKISPYIENVLLEDRFVLEALQKLGLKVARKSWDDPDFDWTGTKYALFRTTWDYFDRFGEFSQWLEKTATLTQFINSDRLITWNMDKHYLMDLANAGIAIPGTHFVEKGTNISLEAAFSRAAQEQGFQKSDFVLKPCVSGAARHTYKIRKEDIAAHGPRFRELIARQAMMIQEFQEHIVSEGEFSLVVLDGSFSHAVLKRAKKGDFRVQDDHGGSVHPHSADPDQIEFAERVVKACPEHPVYARVDIFRDNDGNWALAELEIFEPELWFRLRPEAANILAKAIKNNYLG